MKIPNKIITLLLLLSPFSAYAQTGDISLWTGTSIENTSITEQISPVATEDNTKPETGWNTGTDSVTAEEIAEIKEEVSGTGVTTNSGDQTSIENINKLRSQLIKELSGKDELNTRINSLENTIEQKNIEISTLQNINQDFEARIVSLQQKNATLDQETSAEIEKYQNIIKQNNQRLSEIEAEKLNTEVILENLAKVKRELLEKTENINNEKIQNIAILFTILLTLYWITRMVYQHYKKKFNEQEGQNSVYADRFNEISAIFNIANVITTIVMVLFLLGSILYLKPELAIGLLFFGSAFIVIFKDAIVSFIASIMVIARLKIGDDILYDSLGLKGHGTIAKMTAFYIVVKEKPLDWHKTGYTGRVVNLPNKIIFEQSLIKNSSNYSPYVIETVSLPLLIKDVLIKKDEVKSMWDAYKEKCQKIEVLLERECEEVEDFWIYTTWKGVKWKKRIMTEDDKLIVVYSWLVSPGDFTIKEKVLDIILEQHSFYEEGEVLSTEDEEEEVTKKTETKTSYGGPAPIGGGE